MRARCEPTAVVIAFAAPGQGDRAGTGVHWLHRPLRRRVLGDLAARLLGLEREGAAPPGAAAHGPATPLRVLVAEDNLVNQRVLRLQLERLGHHVETVANGAEALEALALAPYDALLVDLQMPVLDGLAVAHAVREQERQSGHGHLIVVALTASVLPEEREKCIAAGMDDFLSKPVDETEIGRAHV